MFCTNVHCLWSLRMYKHVYTYICTYTYTFTYILCTSFVAGMSCIFRFICFQHFSFHLFPIMIYKYVHRYTNTTIYIHIYICIYIYNNIHTYTWTYTLVSCRKCPTFWISFVSSHDCSHVRCNNSRKWEMIVMDFTYQHIYNVSYLHLQHTLSHAQSRIWAQQLSCYFFSARTLAHYTSCLSLTHTRVAGITFPSVHRCTYASLFHTHIHTLSY